MFQTRRLLFFVFVILFVSCKTDNKYTYAIKDFRKSLQSPIINIVSKGIVGFSYSEGLLHTIVTDEELTQLSKSEHQVLRACAFRAMLYRTSFNHFDIVMNHLDDTAIVGVDHGEFGILYMTVSDYILEEAQWKNTGDKNRTIDNVLTNHNYLKSAYTILSQIEPQEKYYPYIKDMATRKRIYDEEYGEQGFDDIEYAIYGLAKFKKKQDVKIIKELLLANDWRMTDISFTLMREFPDTAYLDVYEKYYPERYYGSICRERSIDKAPGFINSIAVYKNVRSAKILDSILNKKPFINCPADTSYLKKELFNAIWNNPCEAYSKLRKQVKIKVQEYEKDKTEALPVDPVEIPIDTSNARIRWLQ